ncbi:hypothetical protein [Vulcanisaeta sp. JCM 14467]|uniref:hypothetical protein n=1 Tax=Vulcanisaeta sp. JCM 14467 TaxID=1295370 RepID=UPI000A743AE6|nr:hypothetical protein [Vulcanisaeta sp. JCM 14467]
MSTARLIDEALMIIGRARMGEVPCNEALDWLWEIMAILKFELEVMNTGGARAGLSCN